MRATRAIRATSEPRVSYDIKNRVVELELPSYIRWSGIKLFNQVLETLFRVGKALLQVTDP